MRPSRNYNLMLALSEKNKFSRKAAKNAKKNYLI